MGAAAAARKTAPECGSSSNNGGCIPPEVVQQAFDGQPHGLPVNSDGSMSREQFYGRIDQLWAQAMNDCGAADAGR